MTLVHLDTEVSKRKIHDLDLSFVERRLIRVDGYTAEQARAATDLYRCVLVLQVEYPERAIVPPVAADHALHAHILHTRRYAADMQAIFGRVLHHDPDDFAASAMVPVNAPASSTAASAHSGSAWKRAICA